MDNQGYFSMSLSFVNYLEGCKTKFKNFHWSAPSLTYHKIIDKLLDELIEFQDVVAETSQGYCGQQYGVGDIKGDKLDFEDALQALVALNNRVDIFYTQIKSDDTLMGVQNAVNDFQQLLLKFKYLFRLAQRDGSNTFVQSTQETNGRPTPFIGLMNISLDDD